MPEFPGNDAIATGAENCGGTVGAVLESFSNREGPPPDLEPQGQDPKPAPELQAQPPPVEMSSDLAESLPAPELQAQPHPVEKSSDPAESLPAPPALQEQPEAVKAEPQMKKDFSAHVKAGILRIKRELEATEHPAAADKRAKTEPQQGHKVKKERIDPPAAAAAPSAQGIFICRILQIRACREPLKSPKDL